MKCYYRIDESEWIKGHITSMGGGLEINFHPVNEPETNMMVRGKPELLVTLCSRPEVLFCGSYMVVTGYVPIKTEPRTYKIVSVDVSGGWVKPRK